MLMLNGSLFKKNDAIVQYVMEDGTILYNCATEEVIVVNEMGAYIWKLLDCNRHEITIYNLVEKIKAVCHIANNEEIAADIEAFLDALREKHALEKTKVE